jgi:methyl-accepting chemotaxis protein
MKQWIAIIILAAGIVALAVVGATGRKEMAQRVNDLRKEMAQQVDDVHKEMSKRLDDVQADNAFLSELVGVYQEGLKKTSKFTLATSDDLAKVSEHAIAVAKDVTQNMQDISDLKELATLLTESVNRLTDSVNGLQKDQAWLLQQWKAFLDARS